MSDRPGLAAGARGQRDGAAPQGDAAWLAFRGARRRAAGPIWPNELPRAPGTALWRLIADQVRDPLAMALLAAALLTPATGD